MRGFTRPQNVLRSYFGLGPAQIRAEDEIALTLDVAHLATSYQEQESITTTSGAIAPGATTVLSQSLPRRGYWLIDHVSFSSAGPVTSGFLRLAACFELDRAGNTREFGLFDGERILTRQGGQNVNFGIRYVPPVVLFETPEITDRIRCQMTNDSSSVGTAAVTIIVLCRQIELGEPI